MTSSVVCRACLSSYVGMYHIANTGFQDMFEAISKIKFTTGDGKSQSICHICFRLLQRFYNFAAMVKSSDLVFKHLLGQGIQITKHTVSHLNPRKPNLSFTRLKPISINNYPTTPEPIKQYKRIKKEAIKIDKNVYGEVVEMSDVLRDFEKYTVKEELKIEENQSCDVAMNLEHEVTTTLKEEHREEESLINLEHSNQSKNELEDYDDCYILERNEQPIVVDECEPNLCSDNEEIPLVIDEKEDIHLEILQQALIKEKQLEPCFRNELVVDKKESPINNSGITENKPTEYRINAWFELTSGSVSNCEKQSPSKEVSMRSEHSLLRPNDFGIHRAESDELIDCPTLHTGHRFPNYNIPSSKSLEPIEQPTEKNKGRKRKEFFIAHEADNYHYYICDDCCKSFNTRYNLNRHIKKIHPEKDLYKCLRCNIVYKCKKNLSEHYKLKHPLVQSLLQYKYPCDKCKKTFKSLKLLLLHKRLLHLEPITIYSCDTCGKKYVQRLNYKFHILFVHPPNNTKCSNLL